MPYIIRILFSSAIPTDEEKEQVAREVFTPMPREKPHAVLAIKNH